MNHIQRKFELLLLSIHPPLAWTLGLALAFAPAIGYGILLLAHRADLIDPLMTSALPIIAIILGCAGVMLIGLALSYHQRKDTEIKHLEFAAARGSK